MSVLAIDPEMLVEAWRASPPALYIDVRTVAEFAKGRPKGPAVNIPWLFYYPGTRAEHPGNIDGRAFRAAFGKLGDRAHVDIQGGRTRAPRLDQHFRIDREYAHQA